MRKARARSVKSASRCGRCASDVSSFGALTPLLAPRSVAVVGASDRDGNLGGLAVRFLQKYGYRGLVWPVNAGRDEVGGLPCFASLSALPETPDLAIIAVPAESVCDVVRDCIENSIPAAVVWAGGFSEGGPEGVARQHRLVDLCRGTSLRLCGPNCIGVINTDIGLTASFSSLMTEFDHFRPGNVSIVSQSGGIAVNSHARAQAMGYGFRVTISCGNEAVLGVPDFMHALAEDEGTRVIAVYTEGIADPDAFIGALDHARSTGKPVVVLKGGATEESSRAALAHTGKLAGSDRTYEAIFREFAVVRVQSPEELLDASLTLAHLPQGCLPAGNRVLISTFGGGSGVIAADQCAREGLAVPPLGEEPQKALKPLVSPLASTANPIDLTPGAMTNPKLRVHMPQVLKILAEVPEADMVLLFGSGFGALAPDLAGMLEDLHARAAKPICVSWLSPPPGITARLAAAGIMVFEEHSRLIRAAGHVARHAEDTRHRIRKASKPPSPFPWNQYVSATDSVVSEHVVARVLEAAGLPVARGRIALSAQEAVRIANEVGYPVAMKALSPSVTHRAQAGLLALDIDSAEGVAAAEARLSARAAALGVTLEGIWIQHMFSGPVELLVTALRDADFGIIVGCGMGGGAAELIDDVVFTRAPIDEPAARDLLDRLRTLRRLPGLMSASQRTVTASFIAAFSALAATSPWPRFTLEVNPVKVAADEAAAVDGLLVIG